MTVTVNALPMVIAQKSLFLKMVLKVLIGKRIGQNAGVTFILEQRKIFVMSTWISLRPCISIASMSCSLTQQHSRYGPMNCQRKSLTKSKPNKPHPSKKSKPYNGTRAARPATYTKQWAAAHLVMAVGMVESATVRRCSSPMIMNYNT